MTPAEKIRARILEHTLLFLAANVHVQEERQNWARLRRSHHNEHEKACEPNYPEEACEDCKPYIESGAYKSALKRRQTHKSAMVRAYKLLAEAEL
jgi:hypothetical protein